MKKKKQEKKAKKKARVAKVKTKKSSKKQKRKQKKSAKLARKVKKTKKKKGALALGRPKKVFLPEKLQDLIERGKNRGFVTFSEILYFFPEVENDIFGLEKLYEELEGVGIAVKETKELLEPKEKPSTATKPTASEEARIDPIQMYLKEIGKVSFLTAEEEKELARRIEKGDDEAKKHLAKANLRLVVSIAKKYVGR